MIKSKLVMKSDSTIDGTSFFKNTIQKELKVAIYIFSNYVSIKEFNSHCNVNYQCNYHLDKSCLNK